MRTLLNPWAVGCALGLAWAAGILLTGCTRCSGTMVSRNGECVIPCNTVDDCPARWECTQGVCLARTQEDAGAAWMASSSAQGGSSSSIHLSSQESSSSSAVFPQGSSASVAAPGSATPHGSSGSSGPSAASSLGSSSASSQAPLLPDVLITQLAYANGVFTATVHNQGGAATPAGPTVDVGYTVDGTYRTWCVVPGPLAAGATVLVGGTCGNPYVIPIGTHVILAIVDDDNKFAESNETNNPFTQTILVGPGTSSGPSPSSSSASMLAASSSASLPPTGHEYYISPSGLDSNPGTVALPFGTLQHAHDVAVGGDTLYVRGGTYLPTGRIVLTRSGAANRRIQLWAYPGETPIIDATQEASDRVFYMNSASWWHIKGLEIINAANASPFLMEGASHHNIIEANNIHHNGNGIRLYGTSSDNLFLNNDFHHNRDYPTNDGADGMQLSTSGVGTVVRGNRIWRNSDDGIDCFNALNLYSLAPILFENNWVFENGLDDNLQPLGDGNGFKLGGSRAGTPWTPGAHILRNNLAWGNKQTGFDYNTSPMPLTLYNNTAYNNGVGNFSMNYAGPNPAVLKNNLSLGTLGGVVGVVEANNSWNLGVTVNAADFVTLTDTCMRGPRQADGSLPHCTFLHLVAGSDLVDKGVDVGLPYSGAAPDLGAFEF